MSDLTLCAQEAPVCVFQPFSYAAKPLVPWLLLISSVPSSNSIDTGESPVSGGPAAAMDQPHVIPSQGDLLGDLLNLDLGPPVNVPQVSSMQMGAVDLLGGGLDSLVSSFNAHRDTWCWLN